MIKLNTALKWCIGLGLAVFPIHNPNQPLLHTFFLPQVGLGLLSIAALIYLAKNKKWDWGEKWVYLPMFVILGSQALRLAIYRTSGELSSLFILAIFFCLYLAARRVGESIFRVLIPFVILTALSVIWHGLNSPTQTGGIFHVNYDIAAGYMIFGAVVNRGKWQWLLWVLVIPAVYFTGAYEGAVVLLILGGLYALLNLNKKLLPIGVAGLLFALLVFATGNLDSLWFNQILHRQMVAPGVEVGMSSALTGRWDVIEYALQNMSFLGHGLSVTDFTNQTVHNVPLIIVDQLGIPAALAWLAASLYLSFKSKWLYAWVAVLAMGIFDHYTWTQFAPAWWILAGVSYERSRDNAVL